MLELGVAVGGEGQGVGEEREQSGAEFEPEPLGIGHLGPRWGRHGYGLTAGVPVVEVAFEAFEGVAKDQGHTARLVELHGPRIPRPSDPHSGSRTNVRKRYPSLKEPGPRIRA